MNLTSVPSVPSRRLALSLPVAGSCLVLTVASVMSELVTMIALDLRHVRLHTIEDHRLTSTTIHATSGSIVITTCVKVARLLLLWGRLWARCEALLLEVATRRRTGRRTWLRTSWSSGMVSDRKRTCEYWNSWSMLRRFLTLRSRLIHCFLR